MSNIYRRMNILLALIFVLYACGRATLNLPALAKPRELADTVSYLRISREPILNDKFWSGSRPFVFPLLLKITRQNVFIASIVQLGFSIIAWGLLARLVAASIRTVWLKPLTFAFLLALSLVSHLASWDFVMLTESLSISFFIIFLALGVWLIQGWHIGKAFVFCVVSVFFTFTRDTNAYLLLILAVMLLFAVFLRWAHPRIMAIGIFFLLIFLISNYTSEIGGRWIFPLNNIIGKRILPNVQAQIYMETCGMPITPELLARTDKYANGDERAFYNDPALEDYRNWLYRHGMVCYAQWLLSSPIRSTGDAINKFEQLIAFDKLDSYFSRKYDPIIPVLIEPFFYPMQYILPLWLILTIGALIAIWKRAWNQHPLWDVYVLLCIPILPHLFITWHGDAMAAERHSLSVGLQMALSYWLIFFILLDQMASHGKHNQISEISNNIGDKYNIL